jgi:GT2 family glycosyltransferase
VQKPKPYKIVVLLFDDEDNLVNLLKSLVEVGISASDIIISISGSRGNIDELSEIYDFRLIHSDQRLNPSATRNRGASEVKADYIVFLDSDVLVTQEWENALDDISSSKSSLFIGDTVHVSATPNWLELFWFSRIKRGNRIYINGANIIVRKDFFQALGGFDESLDSGEDYDFSIRAARSGTPPILDERLKVFHEGYPKSIKQFIKRERWHAFGDLGSLEMFFKSNVMIAASIYMLFLFLAYKIGKQLKNFKNCELNGQRLAICTNLSLIGYVIAGQFVTVAYYPFLWMHLSLLVSFQNSFYSPRKIMSGGS